MAGNLGLMLQAAFKSGRKNLQAQTDITLPDTRLSMQVKHHDLAHIERFHRLTAWPDHTHRILHPCLPHNLAFPLHMKLMLDKAFPFKLLGLVHIGSDIEQFQPVLAEQPLTLECFFSDVKKHDKGWVFSTVTEARVGDELVWRGVSHNLYMQSSTPGPKNGAARNRTPESVPATENWTLESGLGRAYAQVSGDYNLIHLWPLSAKLFGFKRHIAHGMWSLARCMSAMQLQDVPSYTCQVSFKKPVFLPAELDFTFQDGRFLVSSKGGETLHLRGHLAC